MKPEISSDTVSPEACVSGWVDQFPLTKGLNPFNERNCIRSNNGGLLADDCSRALTTEKLQIRDHVTPNESIQDWSPNDSRDDIRVNLLTYFTIKFNYDYIPHAYWTDEVALTVESQPSWSWLLVEMMGKTLYGAESRGRQTVTPEISCNCKYYWAPLHDESPISCHHLDKYRLQKNTNWMVNSADQFRPIRMTGSGDTKYLISWGEVKPPSHSTAVNWTLYRHIRERQKLIFIAKPSPDRHPSTISIDLGEESTLVQESTLGPESTLHSLWLTHREF